MAARGIKIEVAMLVFALFSSKAAAQTSGCTTALISLAPCISFITGNTSTPSTSCCSQLSTVVTNQAQCLCTLLNGGGSSFGIVINQTQAMALPGACNVQTPPVSQCNAAAPAPSAPATPSVPSNPTPATPSTPSVTPSTPSATPATPSVPSGSKDTPSTTSDGSSKNSGRSLIFATFFVAACVSSLASF